MTSLICINFINSNRLGSWHFGVYTNLVSNCHVFFINRKLNSSCFYVTEDFEVTQGLVIFKIMKIHHCACLMINATPSQVNIISLLSVKVNFFSLSWNEKICRNFIVKQTYKNKADWKQQGNNFTFSSTVWTLFCVNFTFSSTVCTLFCVNFTYSSTVCTLYSVWISLLVLQYAHYSVCFEAVEPGA